MTWRRSGGRSSLVIAVDTLTPPQAPPDPGDHAVDAADAPVLAGRARRVVGRAVQRASDGITSAHPAMWLTVVAAGAWGLVFGRLGVLNHQNFGTWSWDMGIYDQAFWLASRGGDSFITVRGLDVWGHHVNLIAYAFAPLYWLGAGPATLYVVQAWCLALGAVPAHLIARDRLGSAWWGLLFGVVYLMYAPVQWISWAMFHPEALIITPFLFAWWCATTGRWGWYWVMVVLVLSMREDVALALIGLGIVLAIRLRHEENGALVRRMCAATVVVSAAWYLIATRLVLPHFNDGNEPFYVQMFYGRYGDTMGEVVGTVLRRPDMVVHDALLPDRRSFYLDLLMPLGATPLANPLALLMAGPQLLASVIGGSPYARMIRYQYTAIMVAPLVIAAIDGARAIGRHRALRVALPIWLVLSSYVTNVMLSPSPLAKPENRSVWATAHPRHDSMRAALAIIPDDAAVTASFQLVPHLTHRRHVYDWPNPFVPSMWGNDDCSTLPPSTIIDYVALDVWHIGDDNQALFEALFRAPDAPFEVVLEDEAVIVGRRVGTSAAADVDPQRQRCAELDARYGR